MQMNKMSKKIIVIGSGFSGLAAATSIADEGHEVLCIEKNADVGGRARMFKEKGFSFDMGPSWYWMPDVFDRYFGRFGKKTSDYFDLKRLDPSYRVIFGKDDFWDIPANVEELKALFESVEPGSAKAFDEFMTEAEYKYDIGINDIVYKPSLSVLEFMEWRIAKGALKLHLFKSFSAYIRKFFKHEKLLKLLEFPVLFLGAKPEQTPALYSIMNYADSMLGTWYPMGGMHEIIKAMKALAEEKGVRFMTSSPVEEIKVDNSRVTGVIANGEYIECDHLIAAADYHHVEQKLLPKDYRKHDEKYWESRTMAPSSLLFYLGMDQKIDGLKHHNLFFDEDFGPHADAIYDTCSWPEKPLFYICCPSKTDPSVAPEGKENIFILIPTAPGLEDPEEIRENYFNLVCDRLKTHIGTDLRDHIEFKRSYARANFIEDYNSFKGNAYGLANTLKQTAFLKPSMRNKKLKNLVYAGQLTTPGPGVPPSLISGQVAASETLKDIEKTITKPQLS
jgi:phytoene desaturase